MVKRTKALLAALALGAVSLTAGSTLAQPHGGGRGGGGGHAQAAGGGARGGYRGAYGGPRGGYRGGYPGGYGYRGGYGGWGGYGFGLGLGYGYDWAPWGYYPAPYYDAPPYVYDDYDDYEEPAPPPPPPPPAYYRAPPPATRPAAGKSFIVYFPFDREALTEPAKRVVDDAARYAAASPGAKTTIVGYTDAAGSEGYNQALSERRSQVVRETLMADGMPGATIDMAWKGKHDLAVKTPDGVKEPYNRRVTIVVRRPNDEGYGRGGAPEDGDEPGDDRR